MAEFNLDWDNISIKTAIQRVCKISTYQFVRKIVLMESALSGYHVYITTYQHIPEEILFRYRRSFKDDGIRLMKDYFFNRNEDYSNVMFISKRFAGILWKEIPILRLERSMKGYQKLNLTYLTGSSQSQRHQIQRLLVTCAEELVGLQLKMIMNCFNKHVQTVKVAAE